MVNDQPRSEPRTRTIPSKKLLVHGPVLDTPGTLCWRHNLRDTTWQLSCTNVQITGGCSQPWSEKVFIPPTGVQPRTSTLQPHTLSNRIHFFLMQTSQTNLHIKSLGQVLILRDSDASDLSTSPTRISITNESSTRRTNTEKGRQLRRKNPTRCKSYREFLYDWIYYSVGAPSKLF